MPFRRKKLIPARKERGFSFSSVFCGSGLNSLELCGWVEGAMSEVQRNGLHPERSREPLRVEAQVEAREFLKKTGATYVVNTRAYLAAGRL